MKELETGAIEYLVNGDSIEAFQNARPGQGWFDLINFIIRDIAVGLDLPFEFVWNMAGLGGASTRLMSSQAERTFQSTQKNLERRFLNPVIIRRTMWEMKEGRLPFNAEFYNFKITRPAHPSVDVGRESGANLAELDAGVRTEESIAKEAGEDGSEIRHQRDRETRERLELAQATADEFGLPIDFVLTLSGRSNKAQAGSVPSVPPEPAPQPFAP